jgi:hypothetical protein
MRDGTGVVGLVRLVIALLGFGSVAFAGTIPYGESYEFSAEDDSEGWTFQNLTEKYGGPSSGVWYFTSIVTTGNPPNDPRLLSPDLGLIAEQYPSIEIRIANNADPLSGTAELAVYWTHDVLGGSEGRDRGAGQRCLGKPHPRPL